MPRLGSAFASKTSPVARQELLIAQRSRPMLTYALSYLAVQTRMELARVYLALADPAGARTLLREIDELLERRPGLGILGDQAGALRNQGAGRGTLGRPWPCSSSQGRLGARYPSRRAPVLSQLSHGLVGRHRTQAAIPARSPVVADVLGRLASSVER